MHFGISLFILVAQTGKFSTLLNILHHSKYLIIDHTHIKVYVHKLTYPPMETPAATRRIPGLTDLTCFTTSDKSSHFEAQ